MKCLPIRTILLWPFLKEVPTIHFRLTSMIRAINVRNSISRKLSYLVVNRGETLFHYVRSHGLFHWRNVTIQDYRIKSKWLWKFYIWKVFQQMIITMKNRSVLNCIVCPLHEKEVCVKNQLVVVFPRVRSPCIPLMNL